MSIMDGQINISMNARGVDSEIARLQKNIDNFGSRVSNTGKKTSDGVNQIGKGVKDAAYQVDGATTRMAQSIVKQTVALETGGRQAAEYYRQMAQLNNLDSSFLGGYITRLEQAEKKNRSFVDSVNAIRVGIAGTGAFIAGTAFAQIAKYSDLYTQITAQLQNASSSQNQYNQNLAATISIAQQTQAPLESVAKLNASLTRSLLDQGVEQTKINAITRNVALALKAQGSEASQTGAVITQLSQAFASGVLRGDEFNSMAENAPLLQKALADSLGVTVGELRSMAENGELTSEKLVKAFGEGNLTKALSLQAEKMTTLSGAWQALKNEVLLSFGAMEKSIGFFDRLAISTNQLAQGLGIIREYFKGDALKGLNDELKITTDRLAAYDKTDPLTQLIVGGPATREKMIADIKRLSAEIRQLTAPEKPNKATLSTPVKVDKKWQDDFLKDFQEEVDKRNKIAIESAKKLADLQTDISVEFFQGERERIEKLDIIKRDLFVDTVKEEDKRMDDKAKKAEKFAEYQRKLEEDLNGTALKFIQMQEDAQQKAIEKNAAEAQRQYERTQDILTREILNSLNRGFGEKGLSIAENFFQTLKNMAQSVVLEPAIRFVLNSSGITGLANSLGSIFSGNPEVSTLLPAQNSSIIDRITEGFRSSNNVFSSSIEKLGVFLSNGQGGLGDTIGGFLGQYSNQIADGIGYLGAAYMLSQGNVAGAALTAAGTSFGGPIGGAIGSAIGSLFGGSKSPPMVGSQAKGTYSAGSFTGSFGQYGSKDIGAGSSLNKLNEAFSTSLGQLLDDYGLSDSVTAKSIYRQRTNVKGFFGAEFDGGKFYEFLGKGISFEKFADTVLGPKLVKAIEMSKLPESIKDLFNGISDKTQVQTMIAAASGLNEAQDSLIETYGLTAERAAAVAVASGLAGDSLAAFIASLTNASLSQQSAASVLLKERAALTELTGNAPTTLKAFDEWLKSINTTTAEGQKQFADMFAARDRVSSITSAFDSITSARDNALFGLLSQSEQMAISQKKLAEAFADVNAEVPGSRDELVKWVNGLDLTTEAGLKAAMAVPALVNAFQSIEDAANSTANALREMSGFTNLADYRFYKGVANNYGNAYANSYAGVSNLLGSNAQGQTTLNGESIADLKQVLADLRDTSKQALVTQRATQAALEQIQARGLRTV